MIFVYNERQGVRDGQTVKASCLYIYGDRSAHGMRSLFIVYNILYAEMENSVKHKNFHTQEWRIEMENNMDNDIFHTFRQGNIWQILEWELCSCYIRGCGNGISRFCKICRGTYLSFWLWGERLYFQGRFQGQSFPEAQFAFQDGLTEVFYDKIRSFMKRHLHFWGGTDDRSGRCKCGTDFSWDI